MIWTNRILALGMLLKLLAINSIMFLHHVSVASFGLYVAIATTLAITGIHNFKTTMKVSSG